MLGHTTLSQEPISSIPAPAAAAAENDPPFSHRGRIAVLAAIIALHQPSDPLPYSGDGQPGGGPRKIAALSVQVADDPPGFVNDLINLPDTDFNYAQYTRKFIAPLVAQAPAADNPPFNRKSQEAVYYWHYNRPTIQLWSSVLNPTELNVTPIPYSRAGLIAQIYYSWIKPEWPQQRQKFVAPFVTQAPVNNPPFGKKDLTSTFIHWQQEVQPTQLQKKYVPDSVVADKVPFTRKWLDTVLSSWQVEPPLPQTSSKFTTLAHNPPFDSRRPARLQDISAHFVPDPNVQVKSRYIIQPFVAPVDEPPTTARKWLDIVQQHWDALPDRLPPDFYKSPPFVNAGGMRTIYLSEATPVPIKRYWFEVIDDRTMRISTFPGTVTDHIRMETSTTPVGGYIESSTIGSTLYLACNITGQWTVMARMGSWTLST